MESSTTDWDVKVHATARVLAARTEFFDFMKTFTDDLDDLARDPQHPDWCRLSAYFTKWVHDKTHWEQPGYQPEGTPGFEDFNRLLPLILLAVIDEVARRPERLDALPCNPDGSPRSVYRRTPRYLVTTPDEFARSTSEYDDNIALLMEAPWPSITSQLK